ncbi:tRNA (guanosine(37)-N1)-methyltransferase TrmD [Candidatus Parcubacteria bacterium]|nr:tRNA (guanosine(37)-N1)-methyltransferase TrmD [Candidatus Parcubacteria bacterium]
MRFHIITIFPEIFDSYFNESIIKRAQKKEKIKIKIYNLRDWTTDKHKTVDDTPYGGGAGMIMKVDILYKAITDIKSQIEKTRNKEQGTKNKKVSTTHYTPPTTMLTSAKGKKWSQSEAQKHLKLSDIIIICGRYEGVDERILNFVDEEISIGDYVLTGGEIPAMAIVDSITRLIPGVLGNPDSIIDESHSTPNDPSCELRAARLEYPQYTRPEVFIDDQNKKHKIPNILLSGNHAEIEKWKEKQKK